MIKIQWLAASNALHCEYTWNETWKCSEIRLMARADGSDDEACIQVFRPAMGRQVLPKTKLDHIEKGRRYALSLQAVSPAGAWRFPQDDWFGPRDFFYAYNTAVYWDVTHASGWTRIVAEIRGDPLPHDSLLIQTKDRAFPFPLGEGDVAGEVAAWIQLDGKEAEVACLEDIKLLV